MMTVTVKAYAKLNLSLDVLNRREDGFHNLRMLTQTINLCDDITLTLTEEPIFTAKSNRSYLPSDDRNLAVSAAKLFCKQTGLWQGGVMVHLEKRIPVCAGMGGGSADAAAVLRALHSLLDGKLSVKQLCEMSLPLGSDVPFCIAGGTQLMEGRGEILTPLPPLPDCYIVVCKPLASLSTPKVFSWLDTPKIKHRPDTQGLVTALQQHRLRDVGCRVYNVLEDVVTPRLKELQEIHAALIDGGAIGAAMSGTGSAMFGVFEDEARAMRTFATLRAIHAETFFTRPQGAVL